jgi:TonB family protein
MGERRISQIRSPTYEVWRKCGGARDAHYCLLMCPLAISSFNCVTDMPVDVGSEPPRMPSSKPKALDVCDGGPCRHWADRHVRGSAGGARQVPSQSKRREAGLSCESLSAGDEGWVIVELTVAPSGSVTDARVIGSKCSALNAAALTAVRASRSREEGDPAAPSTGSGQAANRQARPDVIALTAVRRFSSRRSR